MLGNGQARIYNLISIIFLVLAFLWVVFVALQLLQG